MTAVLQFEFDRKRVEAMRHKRELYGARNTYAKDDAFAIAAACLQDVFDNIGTLVIVVGSEKITIVQRALPEAL